MGWFSSSPSSTDQKLPSVESPKPSKDGGFIAPDRSARAMCWEGRDNFFACLDKNKIIDSVKESEKAASLCGSESAQFEKNCATSWVSGEKRELLLRTWGTRDKKDNGADETVCRCNTSRSDESWNTSAIRHSRGWKRRAPQISLLSLAQRVYRPKTKATL